MTGEVLETAERRVLGRLLAEAVKAGLAEWYAAEFGDEPETAFDRGAAHRAAYDHCLPRLLAALAAERFELRKAGGRPLPRRGAAEAPGPNGPEGVA